MEPVTVAVIERPHTHKFPRTQGIRSAQELTPSAPSVYCTVYGTVRQNTETLVIGSVMIGSVNGRRGAYPDPQPTKRLILG